MTENKPIEAKEWRLTVTGTTPRNKPRSPKEIINKTK